MLTEKQKKNRTKGIGASEAYIAMGLCPKISMYDLWMIKTGKKEQEDIDHLPFVKWGNWLEELIAKEYEEMTGIELEVVPDTLYHPNYNFILCHLDRKVKSQDIVIEIKTTAFTTDDWGPSESDIIPDRYIIQVQTQLAITGYKEAKLVAHFKAFSETRIYTITRDEDIIYKIINALSTFWSYVEKDAPPPMRDRSDVLQAYPTSNRNYVNASDDIYNTVNELKSCKKSIKLLEVKKKELENAIALYLKDDEGLMHNEQTIATWKTQCNGKRVLRLKEATI